MVEESFGEVAALNAYDGGLHGSVLCVVKFGSELSVVCDCFVKYHKYWDCVCVCVL